ncbi:hypothetical protein HPB52_008373 [Rhipicephalus sanguineus]|uniref:Uncharacterized protein n=1 Tax=Rhipicephalus sanguineus TaxID=34632 RepID=A0A9D4QIF5_RHISA|nr:hypothetical protein HPB52_008373 [Rhipicephalus sanguineus]
MRARHIPEDSQVWHTADRSQIKLDRQFLFRRLLFGHLVPWLPKDISHEAKGSIGKAFLNCQLKTWCRNGHENAVYERVDQLHDQADLNPI